MSPDIDSESLNMVNSPRLKMPVAFEALTDKSMRSVSCPRLHGVQSSPALDEAVEQVQKAAHEALEDTKKIDDEGKDAPFSPEDSDSQHGDGQSSIVTAPERPAGDDDDDDKDDKSYNDSQQQNANGDQSHNVNSNGGGDDAMDGVSSRPTPVRTMSDYRESRTSAQAVRSSMDLQGPQSSSRDRYGFKKQSTFVTQEQYDAWWASYEPYVRRRKRKWVKLMKDSGLYTEDGPPVRFPPKSEKLKRYVRKGIPAEWRGNAWFWFARGHEKIAAHPNMYDKLCKQTLTLRNNDTELIERDLQRTFPDNIYFRAEGASAGEETPLIQALRRVLTAFSVYMPKIGYCQSLNFLAGMLLLFMDEERAFWMLVIITQRYLPGVHEVNLEGVNIDQGVLMLCIRQSQPELWDRLGVNFEGQHYDNILTKLPPVTLCTASWFMSGFIGVLPVETVLRVWDSFFFEESKIFFRVALTILKLSEPKIASIQDQMEIFQVIQNLPKQFIDAGELMEQCFKRRNGFGHISQPDIIRLREFVADRRRRTLAYSAQEPDGGSSASMYNGKASDSNDKTTSTTDLEEFQRLKPLKGMKGLHLARRMKSLRARER